MNRYIKATLASALVIGAIVIEAVRGYPGGEFMMMVCGVITALTI